MTLWLPPSKPEPPAEPVRRQLFSEVVCDIDIRSFLGAASEEGATVLAMTQCAELNEPRLISLVPSWAVMYLHTSPLSFEVKT